MHRVWLVLVGFLALALGLFVSHPVYHTLQSKITSVDGVDVVIAATDLQIGTRVQDKDIRVVRFPTGDLPPNCFHQKSSVVGRGVVLPIAKGDFLLPNKLASESAGYGLPTLIPPGMRAVPVRVNEVSGVAGFVLPGTRVDVLLTGKPSGGEEQTITVLWNVAVIATGQKLERGPSGKPQNVLLVTLLVSPEDAKKLTLASSNGRIQLALRNPLGHPMQDTPLLKPIPPEVPPSPRLRTST
jgi:pilus assembly protein CpaB